MLARRGAVGLILISLFISQHVVAAHPFQESQKNYNSTDPIKGSIEAFINRKLDEGKIPNRLINEKSPYLLQHAFNPVDWYAWGEEAFEAARKQDKPIFLSVGYSTCYWCHVMEREVFENEAIAALMNEYAICIKVDREERPDVDRVYMAALQGMTGGGGWPMSLFLTPDLKPFFAGTYIPPTANYGRQGFSDIITSIHETWVNDRPRITKISEQLGNYLDELSSPKVIPKTADKLALERGFESFKNSFDPDNGGFGGAPKFPRPVSLNFLLRYYSRTGDKAALNMSLETLKHMAAGGMHDHIGGGFHRYSTDKRWHVPHFEKMLYDQAQLIISYLEAYQITKEKFYADVARDALAYIQRSMTHPEGGFYSAQDAESAVDSSKPEEKEEGAFYAWTRHEIDGILAAQAAAVFNYYYGVKDNGNVESDPRQEFTGKNILFVAHTTRETAKQFNLSVEDVTGILADSRAKLFQAREKRPQPYLDDKILVSWNGLMISAFARAHQILGDKKYLISAAKASQFVLDNLYNLKTKDFLRRYRDGEARYEAHLEDYAFFIQGLLDLYEASLEIRWLKYAITLTEQQNKLFYDPDLGGFYDISGNDKSILIRTKDWYDGAEPTGNSIAILNLLRLSQMIDNQDFRVMADKSLAYFGNWMEKSPQGLAQFLVAVDFSLSKPMQIIIAGRLDAPSTKLLLDEVHSHFIPNKIILLADGEEGEKTLASYIPFIQSVRMIDNKATAYICENYTCDLPTADLAVVARLLNRQLANE